MRKQTQFPQGEVRGLMACYPMIKIRFRKWRIGMVVVVVVVSAVGLQANGQDENSPRPIYADLDRDGKAECLSCVKFAETENEGDFYQLRVSDNLGNLIWEGPKVTDLDNPFVFGAWHFGISLPEIAGDIDDDGSVELVTPEPQGDVAPTSFRVLRWKGDRFVEAKTLAGSLLESPVGSGRFPWKNNEDWQGTWISSFESVNPDGTFRVQVFEYKEDSDSRMGEAIVGVVPGGFQLTRWLTPLTVMNYDQESAVKIMTATTAGGTVYRTRLSAGDHANSKGERLTKVGDILRQDRANFHKGNGDAEDRGDLLFSTATARESMDRRISMPVGVDNEASWQRAIVNGTPLVDIEVTNTALLVKVVEP